MPEGPRSTLHDATRTAGRTGARLLLAAGVTVATALTGAAPAAAAHVTSLRPWRASNEYVARDDLDGRSRPAREPRTEVDHVRAGQWVRIECQTTGEEAYGSRLWSRVDGLYVPDALLRTYTDGRLAGAPDCAAPPTTPPKPASTPTNPWWRAAASRGFGSAHHRSYGRVAAGPAARSGDDGIVTVRGFIPTAHAGGPAHLRGDDRGWRRSPAADEHSRFTISWDTATGDVSAQLTPTVVDLPGPDLRIPALPVRLRAIDDVDLFDDDLTQVSNDVGVRAVDGGIQVRMAAVNSVTNVVPVAGAWSVDQDLTIRPRRADRSRGAGGYAVSVTGNAYPAIEVSYYPRRARSSTGRTLFQRRIDPMVLRTRRGRAIDGGGGAAARNEMSWWRCDTRDPARSADSACSLQRDVINQFVRAHVLSLGDLRRTTYRTTEGQDPVSRDAP